MKREIKLRGIEVNGFGGGKWMNLDRVATVREILQKKI